MSFENFEELKQYIEDKIKDRRPEKIQAEEVQTVILGITQFTEDIKGDLPEQTGNTGKMLTSDGVNTLWLSPVVKVRSHHFEPDGKTYYNSDLAGMNLAIFWNDINRFLIGEDEAEEGENYEYKIKSLGGFEITIDGFNANLNSYRLYIMPSTDSPIYSTPSE